MRSILFLARSEMLEAAKKERHIMQHDRKQESRKGRQKERKKERKKANEGMDLEMESNRKALIDGKLNERH